MCRQNVNVRLERVASPILFRQTYERVETQAFGWSVAGRGWLHEFRSHWNLMCWPLVGVQYFCTAYAMLVFKVTPSVVCVGLL